MGSGLLKQESVENDKAKQLLFMSVLKKTTIV
jgi:hypothetical protein